MRYTYLLSLLALAALITPASAKWSRLPSVDKKPVTASILSGTTIDSSKGVTPANALILGDPIKPIALTTGKSEAVLKFVKPALVRSISFVSEGIEGKVALAISGDGKEWHPLGQDSFTPADRLVKIEAGAAQGRYLRLAFDLVRGGTIRGFQAVGGDTDANYSVTQSGDNSGTPVNFAAGIGGGRLLYLSPEQFGNRDEAIRNNRLEFPESDEKFRTAVYDLGQVRALNEFGSVHSPRPVRFAVYAFDSLPEKEDWRGRLAFDPTVFDTTEPVARGEDTTGSGHLTAKPQKVVKARYLALRWEPDFNPPAFSAYSVSITGHANITYTGGNGVVVNTTENADGTLSSTVTVDGTTSITITVDADGNVTVTGTEVTGGADTEVTVDNDSDSTDVGPPSVFTPNPTPSAPTPDTNPSA
ncbi:MAG TPA: hypothetical protein VD994_10100 [Prosthecobacter sp.]|nr:hypothetical protein [Prosthecobacter sp.]